MMLAVLDDGPKHAAYEERTGQLLSHAETELKVLAASSSRLTEMSQELIRYNSGNEAFVGNPHLRGPFQVMQERLEMVSS